jgi:hypothetical protein
MDEVNKGAEPHGGLTAAGVVADVCLVRLIDHLAARRQYYPRLLPTLPDILVIDIPAVFAADSLPLGRYYPIIVETPEETSEVEAFLGAPRSKPVSPDLLDRRASAFVSEKILFVRYGPPFSGWPWLLLCCWPAAYTAMVAESADYFARGTYTTEMFETQSDLERTERRLLATLGAYEVKRIVHGTIFTGQA